MFNAAPKKTGTAFAIAEAGLYDRCCRGPTSAHTVTAAQNIVLREPPATSTIFLIVYGVH